MDWMLRIIQSRARLELKTAPIVINKESYIKLTKNLYKLTLLFPKKEPLRYKMRGVADDILSSPNERDLNILNCFFEVAKEQNWLNQDEILALQKEYANLAEELKKNNPEENEDIKDCPSIFDAATQASEQEGVRPESKKEDFSVLPQSPMFLPPANMERQEKILSFLREQGRAQVWQIKQILPEVTKRTLRRDFENLLRRGLIERVGERNNTFYQIKIVQI